MHALVSGVVCAYTCVSVCVVYACVRVCVFVCVVWLCLLMTSRRPFAEVCALLWLLESRPSSVSN